MKATGIVRSIDNLGRIVIPKEVRRSLGLKEGTKLELFTEGDQLIYRKFSFVESWKESVLNLAEPLALNFQCNIVVTDMDYVLLAAGADVYEGMAGLRMSSEFLEVVFNGQEYVSSQEETYIKILSNGYYENIFKTQYIKPILGSNNKPMGAVAALHMDNPDHACDMCAKIVNVVSEFINASGEGGKSGSFRA